MLNLLPIFIREGFHSQNYETDPDWYPFQICRNPCLYNLQQNKTIDELETLPVFENPGEDRIKCENINHRMFTETRKKRRVPGLRREKIC